MAELTPRPLSPALRDSRAGPPDKAEIALRTAEILYETAAIYGAQGDVNNQQVATIMAEAAARQAVDLARSRS